EAATKVTPAVVNVPSYCVSVMNSGTPQLIDTTLAWPAATETAWSRAVGTPALLTASLAASTSTMLAYGATAWAHSTSRAVSSSQPPVGSDEVAPSFTTVRLIAGRLYCASNVVRSLWIWGASYASTMAMVSPRPGLVMLS